MKRNIPASAGLPDLPRRRRFCRSAHGDMEAGNNPLADKVRAANSRFQDVSVATGEGYAPIPCASNANGSGAMGIHYVNAAYLGDDKIDLARPEAVMYEPMPDGSLALVAVEYITSKGPPRWKGSSSTSTVRPTAMGSARSTSCMSGPGNRTRPARSRT